MINTPRYTLDAYNKKYIFIPVDITEDVIKLVVWKLSGSFGLGVMDPEDL